jgi:DNA-binding beta-propeller fold protein YncE
MKIAVFAFALFCIWWILRDSETRVFAAENGEGGSWQLVAAIDGSESPSGKLQDAVALDLNSAGVLFIVDRGRNRILEFDGKGRFLKEVGGFGHGAEQFDAPNDIDAHLTIRMYVADFNNDRIVQMDRYLHFMGTLALDSDSPYYFAMPLSVAVSNQYDIFILEDLNKRVVKIDRFGNPRVAFGDASDNLGQLLSPRQMALNHSGEIFVSDAGRNEVVVFDYLGNYVRTIKHPDFQQIRGVAVSLQETLIVTDVEERSVFFFGKGKFFRGKLHRDEPDFIPRDAALWDPVQGSTAVLYVLTPGKCLIFENRK